MELKAIIFDFDGTILDTETPEYLAWQEIFRSYDQDLQIETWAACLGTTADHFDGYTLLEKLVKINKSRDEIERSKNKRASQLLYSFVPQLGVVGLIQSASMKGIKLAISSSSNLAWVKGHLSRLNLLEYFDEICTCEDVNRVKPLPDLYLLALLKLGILPDEAIVFEDSPNGAIAANSAGIFCIVIPNPISRNLDISMADMIISNLEHFEMERFIIHRNFL